MAKQLLNYKGLFGDNLELFDKSFIHHEPIQARSFLYNYEITEHLHTDLFQLFLITAGGGLLLSSGLKIPLESPCVLIIPSNRLHGFVFQSDVKGEVFTISETFFEEVLLNAPSIFHKFDQLQYFSFVAGADLFLELLDFKSKIVREIQHSDKASELSLRLLFQLFLLNLYRSKKADQAAAIKSDDRSLNHFHIFKRLIKKHRYEGKTVCFYARELKLTTVHLNRICQTVAQKTTLQIIHEQLIIEAKKYLSGTTNTIAEIAYFLGFKDPAHFSKFFKKKTGLAPSAFRQNNF